MCQIVRYEMENFWLVIADVFPFVHLYPEVLTAPDFTANDKVSKDYVAIKKGEIYVCSECNKEFQTRTGCFLHFDFHRGLTKCKLCSHVSSRKGNLKQHMHFVHGFPLESNGRKLPAFQFKS